MQQVADWLEKLGLGQYVQHFAENDIDASVLPHLTDENLKELGVSLGHRVKLLAAIRKLGGTSGIAEPIAAAELKQQNITGPVAQHPPSASAEAAGVKAHPTTTFSTLCSA